MTPWFGVTSVYKFQAMMAASAAELFGGALRTPRRFAYCERRYFPVRGENRAVRRWPAPRRRGLRFARTRINAYAHLLRRASSPQMVLLRRNHSGTPLCFAPHAHAGECSPRPAACNDSGMGFSVALRPAKPTRTFPEYREELPVFPINLYSGLPMKISINPRVSRPLLSF